MVLLEARDHRLDSQSRRDGERTQIIGAAAFEWSDEVGQGVEIARSLALPLLAARVEAGELVPGRFIRGLTPPARRVVDDDVVAQCVGRPEAVDGARAQPFLFDDLIEQPLRVGQQLSGFFARSFAALRIAVIVLTSRNTRTDTLSPSSVNSRSASSQCSARHA